MYSNNGTMNLKKYYIISKKPLIQYFGNKFLSKKYFIFTCVANTLTLKMWCVSKRIYPYIIINLPLNKKIKTQNRYKPTNLENNYKISRNQKPARLTNRPAKVRGYDSGWFFGFRQNIFSREYLAGFLFEIKTLQEL